MGYLSNCLGFGYGFGGDERSEELRGVAGKFSQKISHYDHPPIGAECQNEKKNSVTVGVIGLVTVLILATFLRLFLRLLRLSPIFDALDLCKFLNCDSIKSDKKRGEKK